MKISEIIIDKYKLRMPPTVYYELLADVREVEDDQEPTDKHFTKADIDAIVKAINAGWELRVNEVLDKIRAEIHATAEMHMDGDYYLRDEWIDEYFDKYKAEVEPQESEEQEPTTKNYLSEEDILELKHRYGDEVEFVVRDMISGEGKRWE